MPYWIFHFFLRYISFWNNFISFRFVSFDFVSFWSVSFRFVSVFFRFELYRYAGKGPIVARDE
jgi:hypothetical protein